MKKLALIFSMAVLVALATSPAHATLALRLDASINDSSIDVSVVDQGAGDLNSAVGAITFSGAVGAFTINVTTGIGSAQGLPFTMDLNSIDVGGPGTLDIAVTDTYPDPPDNLGVLLTEIGGTAGGTVDFVREYVDTNQVLFGAVPGGGMGAPTDVLVTSATAIGGAVLGPFGPGAFSGTGSAVVGPLPAFSMTEFVRLTHTGSNLTTSFDETSQLVPEPGTLLIWSLLAPCAFLLWRRRRKAA